MRQYLDLLKEIRYNGSVKGDRTGTGTKSIFAHQMRFDLREGFPLLTTKKVFLRGVIEELLWFLKGDTHVKYLQDKNVHIWDEWVNEDGDLPLVYPKQWRAWDNYDGTTTDQISKVIETIKNNPESRRILVSAWNVAQIEHMALPPCHCLFQFYVAPDENGKPYWLDLQLYQRSADVFLGVPFNIASYSLLCMMVAQVCDLHPRYFIHTTGDTHLYLNHLEQADLQLSRTPRALPRMIINKDIKNIFDFKYEDFKLEGYDPYPSIKAEVSV